MAATAHLGTKTPAPAAAAAEIDRHRRFLLAGAAMCIVAYFLLLAFNGIHNSLVSGDTVNLVQGAHQAIDCFHSRTFTSCGVIGPRQTVIGPYPLLQYIPTVPMVWLGLRDAVVLHRLAQLNLVAYAGLLIGSWFFGRRYFGRALASLLLIVLIGGPLLNYATGTWGEMLTTVTVTAFVFAALSRRPWPIVITLLIACIGKETLPPFLFVLGVLCTRTDEDGFLPPKRLLIPLAGTVVAGVFVNSIFNEFRFGSLTNSNYLDPLLRVPGVILPAKFAVANWIAPNAGLLWFWTAASIVLLTFAVGVIVTVVRRPRDLRRWGPGVALILTVGGFSWGLGTWVAPFGWIAVGPRLALPIIPAFVIVAMHLEGKALSATARAALRTVPGLVLCAVIGVIAVLPEVGAVWRWQIANLTEISADRSCPKTLAVATVQAGAPFYYHCLENATWRLHSMVIPAATARNPAAVAGDVAIGGATVLLLIYTRSMLALPGEEQDESDPALSGTRSRSS